MDDKKLADLKMALSKERQLEQFLSGFKSALVAFSGGVDSAYLLSSALKVIGSDQIKAVTVSSVLSQPGETEKAKALAQKLKAKHYVLNLDPLAEIEFSANRPDRCYYCKRQIFTRLLEIASVEGYSTVLDGSNADDQADHRPGLRALKELKVYSPLKEFSLGKEEIRALAKHAGLAVWNKQSDACLASRFPYGEKITEHKLKRVAEAELFLRQLGVKENLRVRCHGSLARIEVDNTEMQILLGSRAAVTAKMQKLGFAYVTLDLNGFESGSMNRQL